MLVQLGVLASICDKATAALLTIVSHHQCKHQHRKNVNILAFYKDTFGLTSPLKWSWLSPRVHIPYFKNLCHTCYQWEKTETQERVKRSVWCQKQLSCDRIKTRLSLNCNQRSVQNTLLSHLYTKKSYKYLSCLPKKFVLGVKKEKGFWTFKFLLIFRVLIVNLCPNISSHCFIFFWNMSLPPWNRCSILAIEGQAGFPSGSVVK